MGMDAEILVIGPLSVLSAEKILDYDKELYAGIDPETLVTGIAAYAETTTQSLFLAEILGVTPWDFSTHQIKKPLPLSWVWYDDGTRISDETPITIIHRINRLLKNPNVLIFYLPNG